MVGVSTAPSTSFRAVAADFQIRANQYVSIEHLCDPTQLSAAPDLGCWRQNTPLHPTPRERMREALARRIVEHGLKRPHVDLQAVRCHRSALVQSTAASPRRPPGRSMSLAAGSRWDEKYIWRQRESDLQKRGLRCGVGSMNCSFAAALIEHRQPRGDPEVGNLHL